MFLILELPADLSIALRRFAAGTEAFTNEDAAMMVLREYLIGTGDLEVPPALEEDGEVAGSA